MSRWSFGFSYSAGFFRVGMRWRTWGHVGPHHGPPLWFGPGGYRRPLLATDMTPMRTRRSGRPRVQPGDRTPTNLYNRPENVVRVDKEAMRIPIGMLARVVPKPTPVPNNVFAGKDGKVYQRDNGGNWKVNTGHTWTPTKVPVVPPDTRTSGHGGTPGAGSAGAARPPQRSWPQPPAAWPGMRQPQRPSLPPTPRPQPPTISPTPGNLEREFHARERVVPNPPGAAAPAPHPAPVFQPHPPKEKDKEKAKVPPDHKH